MNAQYDKSLDIVTVEMPITGSLLDGKSKVELVRIIGEQVYDAALDCYRKAAA